MKLTAAKRKKIPTSKFAGPDRSYPIEDRPHARAAKSRASQMAKRGKLSTSAKAKIDSKADKVLKKGKKK